MCKKHKIQYKTSFSHRASASVAVAAMKLALTLAMGLGAIFMCQHQNHSICIPYKADAQCENALRNE